jgi:hypothetical protein
MEYKALLNILNPIRMPPTTLVEDNLNDRHQSCASRIHISPQAPCHVHIYHKIYIIDSKILSKDFKSLTNRVQSIFESWRGQLLSKRGKIVIHLNSYALNGMCMIMMGFSPSRMAPIPTRTKGGCRFLLECRRG